MEQEKKDQRVTIMMSEKELAAVDTWAHENHIKSRGEAVRLLLDAALSLIPAARWASEVHSRLDSDEVNPEINDVMSGINASLWRISHLSEGAKLDASRSNWIDKISQHKTQYSDMSALLEVIDNLVDAASMKREKPNLSRMEKKVAHFIAIGLTNKDISDEIGVTERTLRTYIEMIMKKVGAKNRNDLADFAEVNVPLNLDS